MRGERDYIIKHMFEILSLKENQKFIYLGMIEQFPEIKSMKFATYEIFMQFVSRSGQLAKYASKLKDDFSLQSRTPEFMEGVITAKDELDSFHASVTAINAAEKAKSESARLAAEQYQTKIKQINNEFEKSVAAHLVSDLVKISSLKIENLPLSTVISAEKACGLLVNPSDTDKTDV